MSTVNEFTIEQEAQLVCGARAAGLTREQFLDQIDGLLSPRRRRDTKSLFTPQVRKAILSATVSRH